MGLRIIYGRAGSGKSTYCINEIKNKIETNDKKNRLLLIVPEQFTFETENKLLKVASEKSVLRAEVLSFKRLAHRIFNQCGGLKHKSIKDAGKSMLIHKILEDENKNMQIFNIASKKQGFIDIISKTITEFKKYNITQEILSDTISNIQEEELRFKLQDLKLLYNDFNKRIEDKYIDTDDELTLLSKVLDTCELYDGAEIWVDEFTTFTPQQMEVLVKLMKRAKQVNITLSIDVQSKSYSETDLFNVTKSTEKRLIRAIEENGIGFSGYVDLNEEHTIKFKNKYELSHIENYFYNYPFIRYEGRNERVRIYKANNNYDEIEFVSKDILRLVRDKGYRFRDIAIVCRNIDSYEKIASVILNQYNIPCYIDKKRDVVSNPLIVLITSTFEILSSNWSYESVFKYLKSGLTGIETEYIDILENYILAHGIRGAKWNQEWSYYSTSFKQEEISEEEKQRLVFINEIKDEIKLPLDKLYSKVKGNHTLKDMCIALYEFLIELKVIERVEALVNEFDEKGIVDKAKEYSQVLDIVMEVLDQAVDVLGDENVNIKKFIKILNVGFDKYEMGLIPIALDQVTIGDIARIKSKGVKALYIIGANDGIIPSSNKDEGILSDRDRGILKDNGIMLASDTKTKVFEEQFLVYTALTIASNYLVITYPLADFEGKSLRPSIIIHRLKKILPNLVEESDLVKVDRLKDKFEDIIAPYPTFNKLINNIRLEFENHKVEDYWSDVYSWYMKREEWRKKGDRMFKGLTYTNKAENFSKEKAKLLYSNEHGRLMFSVSRLEKYANCPFSYYIQYGLKAKDRKIYEFNAPDIGSFMHDILDKFTENVKNNNLKWSELNSENCREIINKLVDDTIDGNKESILNSSKRYRYFTDRFKRIITKSVTIISEQMRRTDFEIFKNEFDFGNYKDSNPIKLTLPSGEEVFLTGRIDRIDTLDVNGLTYIRIIDYKSGAKKFDLNQLYCGIQIQLLVYLDALIKNSKTLIKNQSIPGAILYFRIDDPIIKSSKNLSDEEIKKRVLKELKLDGLIIRDAEIVRSMDKDIDGYSLIIPARINSDGSLGKNKSLITEEQFDMLRNYVNLKMIELCDEMISGNIIIEPIKNNKDTACKYCDYTHICQFDTSIKDNNFKLIRKRTEDEIWEDIAAKTGKLIGGKEDGN
ncbi:DNA helicase/exodeoxyribonuclease V, subunit B [Clostridium cavendishii DSM 21758]|uniref:ATP-dependent helicase/deoxyribonuclease subunit B n=1 Tax=Clostridium cavendishii DSM 21758 TaxID=1121302 RepID=A0A1M6SS68_9CLOT|nr:helicase-exonuclease AddAB subunit AddB [Clostridium cavendishii]SHK47480.1 DNA helicase/exodeoxyribonuclease V, subunit B [Clostridium cavendishii DSM 21758]